MQKLERKGVAGRATMQVVENKDARNDVSDCGTRHVKLNSRMGRIAPYPGSF
jgi:hypothetical protein